MTVEGEILRANFSACAQRIVSHHYPELVAARIERLNLALKEAEYVIDAFADVRNYLIRKGFIDERTD